MKRYAFWALVLGSTAVGCGGKGTGALASSAPGAPPPVEQAEALAEDIQTDLARGAWPAAEAGVRNLRSLQEKLDSAGVPEPKRSAYGRAVDSLRAAMARRSRNEALTAGNDVSRIVTGMMRDYPSQVPVEVGYMDVAGRDVLYAAQQGRWSDAAAPVAELDRNYAAVQSYVRTHNFALDELVSSELAQLQRAVVSQRPDSATSLASALLDDVDRIELMF